MGTSASVLIDENYHAPAVKHLSPETTVHKIIAYVERISKEMKQLKVRDRVAEYNYDNITNSTIGSVTVRDEVDKRIEGVATVMPYVNHDERKHIQNNGNKKKRTDSVGWLVDWAYRPKPFKDSLSCAIC